MTIEGGGGRQVCRMSNVESLTLEFALLLLAGADVLIPFLPDAIAVWLVVFELTLVELVPIVLLSTGANLQSTKGVYD